jgi:hypothetical protein
MDARIVTVASGMIAAATFSDAREELLAQIREARPEVKWIGECSYTEPLRELPSVPQLSPSQELAALKERVEQAVRIIGQHGCVCDCDSSDPAPCLGCQVEAALEGWKPCK